MRNRRDKFVVEQELQWRIARRTIATWLIGGFLVFAFPIGVSLMYAIFVTSVPLNALFQSLAESLWFPALLGIMVIPIVVRDSLRFSNRIAGPVMRMKYQIKEVLSGRTARPICLRSGDMLEDLVESVNLLTEHCQLLEQNLIARDTPTKVGSKNAVSTDKQRVKPILPAAELISAHSSSVHT